MFTTAGRASRTARTSGVIRSPAPAEPRAISSSEVAKTPADNGRSAKVRERDRVSGIMGRALSMRATTDGRLRGPRGPSG
ncbi:MAG TPA: hypothetical protein DCQ98_15085 [Planctomycetaceae bacterium]|nr:hypothetical protein [Planctomycetaceae bacterium]